MKFKLIASLAVVCGLAALLYGQTKVGPVVQAGAYQLLSSTYDTWYPTGNVSGAGLFRIDTRTGKTWIYMTGSNEKGKDFDGWRLIAETPFEPSAAPTIRPARK